MEVPSSHAQRQRANAGQEPFGGHTRHGECWLLNEAIFRLCLHVDIGGD